MNTRKIDRDEFAPAPATGRGYSAVESDDPDAIKSRIDRTRADMDETVDALQHKLSLDYMLDRAMGTFRDSTGRSRVLEIVRDNPIPAAMIGAGLTWLMIDQSSGPRGSRGRIFGRSPDEVGHGRDDDWLAPGAEFYESERHRSGPGFMGKLRNKASELGERVSDAASDVGDRVRGTFDSAKDRVGNTANRTGDSASRTGSDLRHRASGMAHNVRDRASEYGHDLRDRASEYGDEIGRRANNLGRDLRHQADRAGRGVANTYEENPLIMGAGVMALGLLLGLAIPTTRAENKLMGEASDELGRRARKLGEDVADSAQRVAERTVDAVREEAKHGELGDSVRNIADKAAHTARDEAKREGQKVADKHDPRGEIRGELKKGVSSTGSTSGQNFNQGKSSKDTFSTDKSKSTFPQNKPGSPGSGI